MDTIPAAEALMRPLQFTADDLHENQTGKLGANQIDRLRQLQRRTLTIGAGGFLAFVLIATVLLFFGTENGWLILTLVGMFLTLLNALFIGIFARQYMRLSADIRGGEVQTLTGELERVVKADRRAGNFVIRIAGAEFNVTKEVFNLFRHEVQYTVYRAPHSGILLAAEPHTN